MYLIPLEFGLLQFARKKDGRAIGVHFNSVRERLGVTETEDLLEHFDNVVVRVVLVIQ